MVLRSKAMPKRQKMGMEDEDLMQQEKTFQYTNNPYFTQGNHGKPVRSLTQETLQDVLEKLEACCSSNAGPNVLLAACFEAKTRTILLNSSCSEWSPLYCSRFIEIIFGLLLDGNDDCEIYSRALLLLNQVVETWTDELLYSSVILREIDCSRTINTTLFDYFSNKQSDSSDLNEWLRLATLVPLVTVLQALSRINRLLSSTPDATPWWIVQVKEWSNIIHGSYLCVCSETSEWSEKGYSAEYMLPMEDIKNGAISFFVQLLEYNENSWWSTLEDSHANTMHEKLLSEAMRLDDPSMPHSSYTRLSLSSLHLLLLLEQKGLSRQVATTERLLDYIRGSNVIENLILATWGSDSTPRGPRWTQRGDENSLAHWTLPILQCLCRTDHSAMMQFTTASSTRRYLDNCWKALLDKSATPLRLYHLCEMVRDVPSVVLDSLQASLSDYNNSDSSTATNASGLLVWNSLLHQMSYKRIMEAGGLFHLLLNANQFNNLSKTMNRAVVVQQLLELYQTLSSHATLIAGQPLLEQIIVDVLCNVLQENVELCAPAVTTLTAEGLEALILTMIPTNRSFGIQGMDFETETDQSTPPAHNLSRIDDRSILIEETRTARGFDHAKHLAVASLLASMLAHKGKDPESHHHVRYNRMDEALQEFMAGNIMSFFESAETLDLLRRKMRLVSLVANTSENELFVSRLIFSSAVTQQEKVRDLQRELKKRSDLLEQLRRKEEGVQFENEQFKRQLRAQSMDYQRSKAIMERSTSQMTKDLMELHNRERTEAKRCAEELNRRMQEMETRALAAEQQVRQCRDENLQLQKQLEETSKKARGLEVSNESLTEQVKSFESKVTHISNELKTVQLRYAESQDNERRLQTRLKEQASQLESLEDNNLSLHESLESIFADMVSLTRLYEIKEKELREVESEKCRETNKLQDVIDMERNRVADAKEKFRQLQYDNEVLSKKYAKMREKLDKERQWRHEEEEKRRTKRGTAAYIDQLHTSSRSEKENRSHHSTSSYRSKTYR